MNRIILSGDRESGKTTFCGHLVNLITKRGYSVSGILTLTEREKKLTALDLATGERKELAVFNDRRIADDLKTRRWVFYPETLEWGNLQIRNAPASDLFLLDEAGILEFSRDRGWIDGLKRMDAGTDRMTLAVVRPELLEIAQARWPDAKVLQIDPLCREREEELLEDLIGLL